MDYENKKYNITVNGTRFDVHVSRIIASWNLAAVEAHENPAGHNFRFTDWLETLGLNEQEIREIELFAMNGKLELEAAATNFLQ